MKLFLSIISAAAIMLAASSSVQALPFNMADKNPQVVAYYEDGSHGIPGEPEYHEGQDLVKQNGKSGSFQQWFYGTSDSEGLHGEHSVWKLSKDGTCPDGWFSMQVNSQNFWGDYLVDGGIYCIKTNDFKPSK